MDFNIFDLSLTVIIGCISSFFTALIIDRYSDILHKNSNIRHAKDMCPAVFLGELDNTSFTRKLDTNARHYMITDKVSLAGDREFSSYDIESVTMLPNNRLIVLTLDSNNRNATNISFCTQRKLWGHNIFVKERFRQQDTINLYCVQRVKPDEIYLEHSGYTFTYKLNSSTGGYITPIAETPNQRAKRIAREYPI